MTTLDIHTIAFPDQELLHAVDALVPAADRAGVDFIVWSPADSPDGAEGTSAQDEPRLGDIDAVVAPYMGSAGAEALSRLPNLKLIQMQSTGYDAVADFVGKVAIATGAGAHADATAELAVGLALARIRGIDDAARNMTTRTWHHERHYSLVDRKALIIGVGGIGEEIRKRLEPFGVDIVRAGTHARDDEHGHVHGVDELPGLLGDIDIVFLITPLTDATHHLVDAEFLAALPDGAMIVNVGRGPVVDTDALLKELQAGRLQAALDVVDPEPLPADHPLWHAPHALITPHDGGDTSAFEPRIHRILADQVRRIAEGEDLINEVHG